MEEFIVIQEFIRRTLFENREINELNIELFDKIILGVENPLGVKTSIITKIVNEI